MNGKGRARGELILFPKTIDYYQIELTKLLEKEAYGEAIRLLEFLIDFKTEDVRTNGEWRTLLEWLSSEFPEAVRERGNEEEEPLGEDELLRRHVSEKAAQDRGYARRLLEELSRSPVDRQLAALDRLAFIEDDAVAEELRRMLEDSRLHPFVGFKLLQTLARLGVQGEATFAKHGEIVTVDIERTPTAPDRFPEPLLAVSERVRETAEGMDPTVALFAKQTWEEFLTYIYGTAPYRELLESPDDSMPDVWASALHTAVARAMYGEGTEEELQERYGITETLLPAWEKAYASIAAFFRDVSGVRV